MLRPLRFSDFKSMYDIVSAIYNGKSQYLIKGERYNVTVTKRQRGTVKLSNNPKIKQSNGGVEFGLKTFLIEDADKEESKVVNLSDLAPEDVEILLKQAREQIEHEQLEKDAIAVYAMKKKDFMTKVLNSAVEGISKGRKITEKDSDAISNKLKALIYAVYKYDAYDKVSSMNTASVIIKDEKQWNRFVYVANTIKDAVIKASEKE